MYILERIWKVKIRSEYVDGIVLSRRRCFLEGRE